MSLRSLLLEEIKQRKIDVAIFSVEKTVSTTGATILDNKAKDTAFISINENNQNYRSGLIITDVNLFNRGNMTHKGCKIHTSLLHRIDNKIDIKILSQQIQPSLFLLLYKHQILGKSRALFRVVDFDDVAYVALQDEQLKLCFYNSSFSHLRAFGVNLVSHELREQAYRRDSFALRLLSDDQIFQLFAWLAKVFGKDVANEIYLFCC